MLSLLAFSSQKYILLMFFLKNTQFGFRSARSQYLTDLYKFGTNYPLQWFELSPAVFWFFWNILYWKYAIKRKDVKYPFRSSSPDITKNWGDLNFHPKRTFSCIFYCLVPWSVYIVNISCHCRKKQYLKD